VRGTVPYFRGTSGPGGAGTVPYFRGTSRRSVSGTRTVQLLFCALRPLQSSLAGGSANHRVYTGYGRAVHCNQYLIHINAVLSINGPLITTPHDKVDRTVSWGINCFLERVAWQPHTTRLSVFDREYKQRKFTFPSNMLQLLI
jgi:hypothetical protein